MRSRVRVVLAGLLAGSVLVVLAAGCARVPGVYVVESRASGSTAPFDAKRYVNGIWSSRIVPTVHDKAVDVATVAAAVAADPSAGGRKYGHQAGTGSPYAFLVRGTGTATRLDRSVPTGPLTVQVPRPGAAPVTVTVATGPVIAGTAVRDAVGFIAFGDVPNQIAYADVANEINDRVRTDVVARLDLTSVVGRQVSFYGAFSELTPGQIFLVPTELRVLP